MILINLLPHREEKRRRRKQAFFVALGMSAAVGALVVGGWYGVLQQLISVQQERNNFLNAEIKKLDEQIKDIATLRAEIDALKARQRAVEDLQTVDGVGDARARGVREGLSRLAEASILERYV